MNCHTYPSANCNIDHILLRAAMIVWKYTL
jgi:hypothetical protein